LIKGGFGVKLNQTAFYTKLVSMPNGASDVWYKQERYLVTKETLFDGTLIKLYAQKLSNKDIVSGNYYPTLKGGMLKPCEMSEEKVIDFVLHCQEERS
jgi:hypothetical protein